MQNTATHEIGHRFDKIVRTKEVELRGKLSGGTRETYTETRTVLDGNYTDKTVKAAAEATIDRSQAAAGGRNLRTASIGDVINADDVFQNLKISDLGDELASEEMLNFFQAVGRSDALAEIRNITSQIVGTGEWGKYASTPTELWARAFNQWHTMKHGSPQAIEDMLEQIARPLWTEARTLPAEKTWYGFQWRQDEFDELIAPHIEKVLRRIGILE